ncbi:MAG: hypothetical protein ACYDAD_11155 [Acidimicrobiales bacterium]
MPPIMPDIDPRDNPVHHAHPAAKGQYVEVGATCYSNEHGSWVVDPETGCIIGPVKD